MIMDGLWDPYDNIHMGSCGEKCAQEFTISRKEQDDFSIESLRRALQAHRSGVFTSEIAPVQVKHGRKVVEVSEDESLMHLNEVNEEKIRSLKPAFDRKNGTITAANASTISDGAAALVLMSEEKSEEINVLPLARIVGYADAEQEPVKFPTTPSKAIEKLMAKHPHLSLNDVSAFEINEAFAAVVIANMRLLGIPHDKVNQRGGACALGHPIGCSGARILVTLLSVLKEGEYGIATLCNGGGGATAVLVQKTNAAV